MNEGIVDEINNGQYATVHLVIIVSICIETQNTNKKRFKVKTFLTHDY